MLKKPEWDEGPEWTGPWRSSNRLPKTFMDYGTIGVCVIFGLLFVGTYYYVMIEGLHLAHKRYAPDVLRALSLTVR